MTSTVRKSPSEKKKKGRVRKPEKLKVQGVIKIPGVAHKETKRGRVVKTSLFGHVAGSRAPLLERPLDWDGLLAASEPELLAPSPCIGT